MDWVRGTSEKRFTVLAADFPHQELIDVIVSQNIGLSVTCAQPPPIGKASASYTRQPCSGLIALCSAHLLFSFGCNQDAAVFSIIQQLAAS